MQKETSAKKEHEKVLPELKKAIKQLKKGDLTKQKLLELAEKYGVHLGIIIREAVKEGKVYADAGRYGTITYWQSGNQVWLGAYDSISCFNATTGAYMRRE